MNIIYADTQEPVFMPGNVTTDMAKMLLAVGYAIGQQRVIEVIDEDNVITDDTNHFNVMRRLRDKVSISEAEREEKERVLRDFEQERI
jgi:hypothetical protein